MRIAVAGLFGSMCETAANGWRDFFSLKLRYRGEEIGEAKFEVQPIPFSYFTVVFKL